MVAVSDQNRQVLQGGVDGGVDCRVGDHPEAVVGVFGPGERDGGRPRGDPLEHLRDPGRIPLVEEPQRLEADPRRAEQRQTVLLWPAMCPLVWQDDLVRVRLEAQPGDQVTPHAAVEAHLVDVHRAGVGFEDSLVQPPLESPAGALVVGSGSRQMDDVVGRKRAIVRNVRLGNHVIGRCDEIARVACPSQVVPDPGQRPYVSRRS